MPTPEATHIAKPLMPTLNPKLVKECVFPNAERKRKHGHTTKCICHKGFSGYSSVVARSNFRVGGQETTPQSLTAHTLDRYRAFPT